MSAAQPKGAEPADKAEEEEGHDDAPMTIWEHLAELRKRVAISLAVLLLFSVLSWEFRETLLTFLVNPFVEAWQAKNIPGKPTLHFQTPAAAFLSYFKLSLLAGATISTPVIFYQLWAFVAPGLYAREKKFVIPFVMSSTGLAVGGGYFGWRLAMPLAFGYLLDLGGDLNDSLLPGATELIVTPTVMMGDYIDFVTRMLLGFGLIFEIPLLIFFLSVAGVVNYLQLIRYGRWFVVGSFLAAAIITPPDITSQIMMAIPMIVLYAGSILLAYFFGKPPTDAQREAYAARKKRRKLEKEKQRQKKKKSA